MQTDKIPSEIEINKNTKTNQELDSLKKQQPKQEKDDISTEKVIQDTTQSGHVQSPSGGVVESSTKVDKVAVVDEANTVAKEGSSVAGVSCSSSSSSSSTSDVTSSSTPTEAPKRLKQPRCELPECKKRIGFMGYNCNCGSSFCAAHRHAKDHRCTFDYKSADRKELLKRNGSNSSASFSKVTKI